MSTNWQSLLEAFASLLPIPLVHNFAKAVSVVISVCAVVARFWSHPKDTSKWLWLYLLINKIAMNDKHAKNARDPPT